MLQNMTNRGHTVKPRAPSLQQASSSEVMLKVAVWGKPFAVASRKGSDVAGEKSHAALYL